MIILIIGFSKSGTTLVAKTLHAAGINFRDVTTGDYPASPYEDPIGCDIIMESFGVHRKRSLYVPGKINYNVFKIKEYIEMRSIASDSWGFKFPYLTFVYGEWEKYLPEDHICIALKRQPESLLTHYTKNRPTWDKKKADEIWYAQKQCNNLIDAYGVPVINFEDLLKNGPIEIEKVTGLTNLKDFRNYHGKGDGRKYL